MITGHSLNVLYRATLNGKLFKDEVANHTVIGYAGGVPTPIPNPKPAAIDGYFVAQVSGQIMSCPDFTLIASSNTPGVLLDILPTVTTVPLPKVAPGEEGGLLLVGTTPGCLNPKGGAVVVHEVADGAIKAGSFVKNSITASAVEPGIINAEAFADRIPDALAELVVKTFTERLIRDGVLIPTVRFTAGTGPGELSVTKGAVAATVADKSGCALDEASATSLSNQVADLLKPITELMGDLAKSRHIDTVAEILSRSIDSYEALFRKAADQHTANIDALKMVAQKLSGPLQAHVTALGDNPQALATLIQFLTTGVDLQSTLKGVQSVADGVRLAEGQSVNVEALGGSREIVKRLLASITDNGTLEITADIKGSIADAGLSPETLTTLVDSVFEKLRLTAIPELSGVPAANSSLLDKLTWLFMESRNEHEVANGQERLKNDGGTTAVAIRKVVADGTKTINRKWGA